MQRPCAGCKCSVTGTEPRRGRGRRRCGQEKERRGEENCREMVIGPEKGRRKRRKGRRKKRRKRGEKRREWREGEE